MCFSYYQVLFYLAVSSCLLATIAGAAAETVECESCNSTLKPRQLAPGVQRSHCYECLGNNMLWVLLEYRGWVIRKCADKMDESYWRDLGARIRAPEDSCEGLDGNDRNVLREEVPKSWPNNCEDCIRSKDGGLLVWYTNDMPDEPLRICYPERMARGLPAKLKTANIYPDCKGVPLGKETQNLPRLLPHALKDCDSCVGSGKYQWCLTHALGVDANFCASTRRGYNGCPGGLPYTDCSEIKPEARKKEALSFAENCEQCVRKDDLVWCVLWHYAQKFNRCVPRSFAQVLCSGGDVYDDCFMVSEEDRGPPDDNNHQCIVNIGNAETISS